MSTVPSRWVVLAVAYPDNTWNTIHLGIPRDTPEDALEEEATQLGREVLTRDAVDWVHCWIQEIWPAGVVPTEPSSVAEEASPEEATGPTVAQLLKLAKSTPWWEDATERDPHG